MLSDGQIMRQPITKSFTTVEDLMHYCIESDHGIKTAQRAIREFMSSPQINKMSDSVYTIARAAIKSYFNVNDITLNFPKGRKKRADQIPSDDSFMTLNDFYKMLQKGNPGIMMRTIMMIKLHSGMDSSTFTDRFNYEGYQQIVTYFKTDEHMSWNLELCPVPIKITRVKTGVHYTTFLDRDAITQLQEYLTWKETKYDKQDISKPLFLTKHNTPIHAMWLSTNFSKIAVNAGIQKKISPRVYKIRAHEVRDILKSTLLACGCKQYAADHVLGHAPRDSYEKQALMYPEELRAEYAKASSRLNIFSKVENTLNTADDPESLHASIKEVKAELSAVKQSKTEGNMKEEIHNDVIKNMRKELQRLAAILNALPDNIKEQITDNLEDSDKIEDSDSTD